MLLQEEHNALIGLEAARPLLCGFICDYGVTSTLIQVIRRPVATDALLSSFMLTSDWLFSSTRCWTLGLTTSGRATKLSGNKLFEFLMNVSSIRANVFIRELFRLVPEYLFLYYKCDIAARAEMCQLQKLLIQK